MTNARRAVKKKTKSNINLNRTVLLLRKEKGLSGVELCRKAGDLDPKTLTAFEKGRIKNPSIQTLTSLARGLDMSVSRLFRLAELGSEAYFFSGTQKGVYKIDFPSSGVQLISFTPLTKNFFCGKIIFEGRKKMTQDLFKHQGPFFVMVMIGAFDARIEGRDLSLKEGDNLYFDCSMDFTIENKQHRNSTLLVISSPSIL